MLDFPKSTAFGRRFPKQKFYENLDVSAEVKRLFVEQVKLITWANKLSHETMNIASGQMVLEIEVFRLTLQGQELDGRVLELMDRQIPYHILFLLEYGGKYQAWIGYKEAASGSSAFKVSQYYHTDWMAADQLPLRIEGHSLDAVYENFVRQVAGENLAPTGAESLHESVERDIRRQQLQKQITALDGLMRS